MKARVSNKEKHMKLWTSMFSVGPVLVGLAVLLMTSGQARATLLAEDTFNYPSNSVLDGQSGGTGWGTNKWGATDGGGWTNLPPGLLATGVVTSRDNCAKSCTSSGGTRTASRTMATNYTSGVIYLGALLRYDTGSVEYGYLQATDDYRYDFKIGWSATYGATTNYWSFAGGKSSLTWSNTFFTTIPVIAGQAFLTVMKINLDTKTAYLYINQKTEGTPDASATGVYNSLRTITVRTANGGATMDDLRLATTYAEAVYGASSPPPPKATVVVVR